MSINILLVDDNPKSLLTLEAILADLGATLVKARSGPEAIMRLREDDFALILLDVGMPDLDGYETAELIRQRDRCRHVPIIFLAPNHKRAPQVFRGYSLGAVDYLTRPIAPTIARAKVQVFVDLHKKTLELREAAEREQRQRFEQERHQALARKHAQLELVAGIAHRLLVDTCSADVARDACEKVARQLGLEVFLLYLADEAARTLRLEAQRGLEQDVAAELQLLPYGRYAPGEAAVRQSVGLADEQALAGVPDLWPASLPLRSHLCVPLVVGEARLLGILALGSRGRPRFARDEVELAEVVARQVAAALDRAALVAELQARDRQKDEFLAILAHELRNPLAPAVIAVDLLDARLPEAKPEVARPLASLHRQVTTLSRLVDDLLDVSRITTGKIALRREGIDLTAVVEAAVQTSSPLIVGKGHALTVDVPAGVRLQADGVRLIQVIANLLNNAAKYTDLGGRIHLAAEARGRDLVLCVRDNGIGIAPELRSKIFDPFVQIDPHRERSMGGLGLGLALVKRLVELHGGTVDVVSPGPGQGSAFTVTLPVVASAAASDGARASSSARGRRSRVLVVDDNPDILEMMKEVLSFQGHEVHVADDGLLAVEMAMSVQPEVVLIDLGLPGLDGYGVAQRLRSAQALRTTRLVALSGYGQPQDRDRAVAAGFDLHLVKPIDATTLARVIEGG